jgi:hypothetical protein
MRALSKLVPLVLFGTAVAAQACGSIKVEDTDYAQNGRRFPVKGVIRGSVIYQGPQPCSVNGHIVGNAILLVFDRRNPPPPDGLANTAVNFIAVAGDTLFANEPREPSATKYCPKDNGDTRTVTVSAPFAIAPMDAGRYMIQAFYDYAGDFLPTFKFRNLPVAGDIGGGYIDTQDANALIVDPQSNSTLIPKSKDANYQPKFLDIDIGIPGDVPPNSARNVPVFTMPPEGFVADNITVSIGAPLPLPRPYFFPAGAESPPAGVSDDDPEKHYTPVLKMNQDHQVYAQPVGNDKFTEKLVDEFQASFPQIILKYGLPDAEVADAVDPKSPFHLQVAPRAAGGGIFIWRNGTHVSQGGSIEDDFIPEQTIPRMWPLVVFAKLKDDPDHINDPQSLVAQGSDGQQPIVILQGITLSPVPAVGQTHDSLFSMVANQALLANEPSAATLFDHVAVMLRPSVLCMDPRHTDRGGTLVTPHLFGELPPGAKVQADGKPDHPVVSLDSLRASAQLRPLLNTANPFATGCLPKGRYGINVVYSTGQAWTTPNEMGSCSKKEGAPDYGSDPGTCKTQARPVLYSQGTRAVIEIIGPKDEKACLPSDQGGTVPPVPDVCTTLPKE